MSEVKDSAIKLFGRTISLPPISNDSSAPASSSPCEVSSATQHEAEGQSRKEFTSIQENDEVSHQTTDQDVPKSATTTSSSIIFENSPKTPPSSEERENKSSLKPSTNGEQSDTTSASHDNKTLKKPDKILPCPRCNSMDTKFCYYNNYNVNQPRHFCKNCQRYWTAGGTMRNVPVGAGRRKNKNSPASAQYHHQIMVPDAIHQGQGGKFNPPNGAASSVLTFGSSDSHLCDSMASSLNIAENDTHSKGNNSHHLIGVTNDQSMDRRIEGYPPQFPYFPTTSPWPYPPAFCPTMPFYTPSYWGCVPSQSWNMPCFSPQQSCVNQPVSGPCGSSPNSPKLGKHLRNGNIIDNNNTEKEKADSDSDHNSTVLVPKTLRIHDPNEASRSSIWSTLGIKNEMAINSNSLNGGGLFKAFPSKGNNDNKNNHHMVEASVLHANPAALSRSLIFHEQT